LAVPHLSGKSVSYAVDCEKLRAILGAKAKYSVSDKQVKHVNVNGMEAF